jgi:hypothetical protein
MLDKLKKIYYNGSTKFQERNFFQNVKPRWAVYPTKNQGDGKMQSRKVSVIYFVSYKSGRKNLVMIYANKDDALKEVRRMNKDTDIGGYYATDEEMIY